MPEEIEISYNNKLKEKMEACGFNKLYRVLKLKIDLDILKNILKTIVNFLRGKLWSKKPLAKKKQLYGKY